MDFHQHPTGNFRPQFQQSSWSSTSEPQFEAPLRPQVSLAEPSCYFSNQPLQHAAQSAAFKQNNENILEQSAHPLWIQQEQQPDYPNEQSLLDWSEPSGHYAQRTCRASRGDDLSHCAEFAEEGDLKPAEGKTNSTSRRDLSRTPPEKIIQRVKANKKERRRTQSINQAFSELRKHIPDVPSDTKLSKIKTLRLAISYINHLMATLNGDDQDAMINRAPQAANGVIIQQNNGRKAGEGGTDSLVILPLVPTSEHGPNSAASQDAKILAHVRVDKGFGNKDRKHRTGWPEINWKNSTSLSRLEASRHLKL